MSSIPNSAMPHARAIPSAAVAPAETSGTRTTFDRIVARTRTVPVGAWLAGAAALGVAAAAAATSLRERTPPKKRASARSAASRAKRKAPAA